MTQVYNYSSAPRNFHTVDIDKLIYRGAQPASAQEWAFITSLGVRQVVKLNLESEASDAEWMIQNPTGSIIYCPIPWWEQIVTEPDYSQIVGVVDCLNVPTFIHCEHGINRTGLVVALYRVRWQDWTPAEAHREWRELGAIPLEQEGLEKAFEDLTP